MNTINRRYDIDWLRVIAIGLLLIYHIAIVFQPWGALIMFMQNNQSIESIWIPMSAINVWRIPLLFFVSGMGVSFAMRKRSWKKLIAERSRRILLPFVFGMFVMVPPYIYLWQSYYNQDLVYSPNPGHLWFLGNIFMYVLILSPLFYFMIKNENSGFARKFKNTMGSAWGILLMTLVFIAEVLILNPDIFELYVMTLHGFVLGLLAFFFGFCCVYSGDRFWQMVDKWKFIFLGMALVLYGIRLLQFELNAPKYLMAVESISWIMAVFGFGYRYLNRPGKVLSYLSQAAYPIYIVHMFFLYLGSYWVLPMDISAWAKLGIITVITFVGSFGSYELIIRRVNFLRPLFGLKMKNKVSSLSKNKNMDNKIYEFQSEGANID